MDTILNKFKKINKIILKVVCNRIFIITYFTIVFMLLIITLKNHEKQELEHFNNLNSGFKNKFVKYSECKKKCSITHTDPDKVKVCKSYCKCKKKCTDVGNNKKCFKKCKDIKMNIYRDDEDKMEKIRLKQELKSENRKIKKQNKIEEERENIKKEKEATENTVVKSGYLTNLINKYSTEKERQYLVDLNSCSKRFSKDIKKIFRFK